MTGKLSSVQFFGMSVCLKSVDHVSTKTNDEIFEKNLPVLTFAFRFCANTTRRERLKSALYLRLKKRKTFF